MSSILVFDMDDTLYLERDYVRSGFYFVDEFLLKKGIIGFYSKAWSAFLSGYRSNTFNVVLDELNVDYSSELITALVKCYRQHDPVISLCEDVALVLNQLKNKYTLGVITDGDITSQKNKFSTLNISEYISKVIFTDALAVNRACWKPHRQSYDDIVDYFNVEHNQCVYIGDNEEKDFITAKKLGWKTIRIVREGCVRDVVEFDEVYKADFNITSFHQLEAVLCEMERIED